jgi:hypothetical protein
VVGSFLVLDVIEGIIIYLIAMLLFLKIVLIPLEKLYMDMYKISCAGGGVGFNVSKLRPKGDDIGSVKNSAPGAVSVLTND